MPGRPAELNVRPRSTSQAMRAQRRMPPCASHTSAPRGCHVPSTPPLPLAGDEARTPSSRMDTLTQILHSAYKRRLMEDLAARRRWAYTSRSNSWPHVLGGLTCPHTHTRGSPAVPLPDDSPQHHAALAKSVCWIWVVAPVTRLAAILLNAEIFSPVSMPHRQ